MKMGGSNGQLFVRANGDKTKQKDNDFRKQLRIVLRFDTDCEYTWHNLEEQLHILENNSLCLAQE